LYGKNPNNGFAYMNFGGDKAWPSPQSAWGWPPPRGFDGRTNSVLLTNGTLTLVSTVDSNYKIQVRRVVELIPGEPVMRVTTSFERTEATAALTNELGVWIDCQAAASTDSRCYVPVPSPSIFSSGYTTTGSAQFTAALPPAFTNSNGLISFGTPLTGNQKLGFDTGTLVLVGSQLDLRVDAPRIRDTTYPDGNCNSEVYTAQGYFELELLGPLATLPVGGKMQFITVYSLFHRTETTTDAEARKVLSWHY
jgi:hypothetical protein